jgi:hypothetical protein
VERHGSDDTRHHPGGNYDLDGQNVAYNNLDNGRQTDYRGDNIGVYADSSASNDYAVGWNFIGEWMACKRWQRRSLYHHSQRCLHPDGGTFHLEFGPGGQVGGVSCDHNSGVANLLCRIPEAGR